MLHLREILLSLIFIIPSISAHAADGRTMTDKLTCYNYEERIVFILDLKKDNEKLNRMNLAVVKRTKDSIELTAPDLLVKFDSINFVLDVVPTKASEALSMECTPY
jgi:mevalonate pyrophosphate decarboxylase